MNMPTVGRIVHYVLPNGQSRPAIVVAVHGQTEDGRINLQVFLDGTNDESAMYAPPPPPAPPPELTEGDDASVDVEVTELDESEPSSDLEVESQGTPLPPASALEHTPLSAAAAVPVFQFPDSQLLWVTSVPFADPSSVIGPLANTWHWPPRV